MNVMGMLQLQRGILHHMGARPGVVTRSFSFTSREERRRLVVLSRRAIHDGGVNVSSVAEDTTGKTRLGKRKVALFVGYDGTHYRGLQMQPSQLHLSSQEGHSKTIEEVLEAAIFASGGILESNRGNLGKVGWSRSSRTDKRVHSVSTVISMKLECDPDMFESEPDGGSIAKSINEHLPPEVRVFAVQRVVKSFDARRECMRRYYEYYVPVSFFSLMIEKEGYDTTLENVLARLGEAWRSYQGHHAFHNFTKRRLYRPERDGAVVVKKEPPTKREDIVHSKGMIHFEWKAERDERDPIVRSHYRFVEDCHCSTEPLELVEQGGEPCVKLSVCGASFMLHQIRHMVGGAVLVALGKMSLELLQAALAPPVRMNLPLAPPGTLVLRGADFGTFRKSYDGKPSPTERSSGSSLVLLPPGLERQQEFETSVLYQGLHRQLQHEDWQRWSESLSLVQYDVEEADSIVQQSVEWFERREEMKRVRRRLREESAEEESSDD
jgi:tRNA pseudouridine38-40 synthase